MPVWDGSTGETHPGYWLLEVTGAEVRGSEIVAMCQKLFSAEAQEFRSENAEILAMVDQVDHHLAGRGIWTVDRGGDRKKLLEPLLDKGLRFVIRSTGERTVVDRRGRLRRVAEVALGCPLRHQARVENFVNCAFSRERSLLSCIGGVSGRMNFLGRKSLLPRIPSPPTSLVL